MSKVKPIEWKEEDFSSFKGITEIEKNMIDMLLKKELNDEDGIWTYIFFICNTIFIDKMTEEQKRELLINIKKNIDNVIKSEDKNGSTENM